MFSRQLSEEDIQLGRCFDEVLSKVEEREDNCVRAAVEYLCRRRLGGATPLDKIAAKYNVQLICVYKWYEKLFQMGFKYPRDGFEYYLELVKRTYGEAVANEIKRMYEFLKSKGAVDGLKIGGVVAALLYYAARKHGVKYDVVKAAYEFDSYPETVVKNIVLFQWYIYGII